MGSYIREISEVINLGELQHPEFSGAEVYNVMQDIKKRVAIYGNKQYLDENLVVCKVKKGGLLYKITDQSMLDWLCIVTK